LFITHLQESYIMPVKPLILAEDYMKTAAMPGQISLV
jgi:hypothetical protein